MAEHEFESSRDIYELIVINVQHFISMNSQNLYFYG
ncbi:hypothetical protein Q428_13570 [Fervidicella metallireducens AeB]|uniref:Uncharacterized protein n=1 Tax=Fervidicella metallireducens AeB TaxID=1403537 RepID=A0A017RRJ0_9CLOT|nr:hypothetical protein Q428_13570 [Fervidicella metallireducens AeB]